MLNSCHNTKGLCPGTSMMNDVVGVADVARSLNSDQYEGITTL